MKNFALGLILATGAASLPVHAASDIQANPSASSYLQDGRGIVVRSGQGLCWRTGYWTQSDALVGCDGELVPPITKATAPPIISPSQPASAPAEAIATVPQRCDFVTLLGNDQAFAFNQAVLSNAAKGRIDEVVSKLENCAEVEAISVTGHTDRLGSQQYNLRLSEKRAQAVAHYLNAKGVSAKINATGVGSAQPIKECNNSRPRKQFINCLSPNRRVVVEVRGVAKPSTNP